MALVKRTYVDGETIITAQNLNDIQDEIISHANTFVPKTRTINSKALDANITLTASDLGAVPTTRTVNGKALSSNITLTAANVGAAPTSHASTATTYGKGTSSNYGHVKISDSLTDTTTAATGGVVPSMKAVSDLNSAITDKILYFTSQAVSATTGNILDISNAKITADYVLLECTFATPTNITTKLTWTTSAGHFVLNGTCTTATTANVTLGKKGN